MLDPRKVVPLDGGVHDDQPQLRNLIQQSTVTHPSSPRNRCCLSCLKNVLCIFGLPFSVAPFPLAYMCPWLVILPLWQAGGWECTGRTEAWKTSWFNDIFWRVMGLFKNLNTTTSLGKICPSSSFSLFLGQVISLACWKSILAGSMSIFPVLVDFKCSRRLCNLITWSHRSDAIDNC